jgi:hypothetical protein
MAPRLRSAVVRFDALPEPAQRSVMLALPVDARARAACVCRSWRALLADVSFWQVLHLTPAGGVAAERVTENLARGAVARAAGHLRSIGWNVVPGREMKELLVALVQSDGAELQEVSTNIILSVADLQAVLAAAPRLQVLNTCIGGGCTELLPVLRNDPPYGALRASSLSVSFGHVADDDVLALASAVAAHQPVRKLTLSNLDFTRGLNALVDAAAERLTRCRFIHCRLDGESVSALARVMERGLLTELAVAGCGGFPEAQEESALCAALRQCHTLTNLQLHLAPWNRTVLELLDAAAALPALAVLDMSFSRFQDKAAAGRAFGALLSANLPSLRTLNVDECELGDEGLAPLLDGLAANTHLRELECLENETSEEFERNRLAPALDALRARRQLDA